MVIPYLIRRALHLRGREIFIDSSLFALKLSSTFSIIRFSILRAKIDDAEDIKPEDFDKPEHIADPDATKPEDWDDEMDGEWEPPMIDNPEYKVG